MTAAQPRCPHDAVDAVPPLLSWLTLTDWHEASSVAETLADWLGRVYLRYDDAVLASCWAWHPDVIEELWWLRNAWAEAYLGPNPEWEKVAGWHDRHRPGVVKRVGQKLGTCGLELHTLPPPSPVTVPLSDALPHVVTAWATPQHQAWPPTPTDGQLVQAQAEHDELARWRRSRRAST